MNFKKYVLISQLLLLTASAFLQGMEKTRIVNKLREVLDKVSKGYTQLYFNSDVVATLHNGVEGYCSGEFTVGFLIALGSAGKNGKCSLVVGATGLLLGNFLLNEKLKKGLKPTKKKKNTSPNIIATNNSSVNINNKLFGRPFFNCCFFWAGLGSSLVNQFRKLN